MSFTARRDRLRHSIASDPIDGLLVSSATNVGYLTGFTGEDATFLLTPDRAIIISDGRFTTQLAEECPDLDVVIRPIGQTMAVGVAELVKGIDLARLGIEGGATTVDDFHALREAADPVAVEPISGKVESLRMLKDDDEIAAIRDAIAIAERAFLDLRAVLRPGLTEKWAADFLEAAMRFQGATAASFPPIVAAGPRAALPHARPTPETRIGDADLILIDWGATGRPYKSDLTRVLVTGKVTPRFEAVYRVVFEAQSRAINAIRPGVVARVIDAEARGVIEAAGFGPHFSHSVGHGIGRDVHEAPVLRHVTETQLEAGMVVTIEPGVYLPGWGGVRIEDDVLVTETGHEVLSTLPKTLDSTVL